MELSCGEGQTHTYSDLPPPSPHPHSRKYYSFGSGVYFNRSFCTHLSIYFHSPFPSHTLPFICHFQFYVIFCSPANIRISVRVCDAVRRTLMIVKRDFRPNLFSPFCCCFFFFFFSDFMRRRQHSSCVVVVFSKQNNSIVIVSRFTNVLCPRASCVEPTSSLSFR